jgi:hypothetical protein
MDFWLNASVLSAATNAGLTEALIIIFRSRKELIVSHRER